MAICLGRRTARPPRGGCPVPWPRRAASTAMLRVAAGRITLFTPVKPAVVSVALAVGLPTPACAGHPALRCLDFPPRRYRGDHPSSCDQVALYHVRLAGRRTRRAWSGTGGGGGQAGRRGLLHSSNGARRPGRWLDDSAVAGWACLRRGPRLTTDPWRSGPPR